MRSVFTTIGLPNRLVSDAILDRSRDSGHDVGTVGSDTPGPGMNDTNSAKDLRLGFASRTSARSDHGTVS